jgi:cell pole-organizing protein PopZ
MSDAKSQPDPSMEQILASINRIIAEDKGTGGALGEPPREVLELTEAIAEDGSIRHLTPLAMASASESGRAEPQAPRAGEPARKSEDAEPAAGAAPAELQPAGIASPATASAAAGAFVELAAAAQEKRRAGELSLGGGDRTLEAIVREALRPLLQTWLDQNLPGVVERLVREEIARAAREAGLR